jgi:L-histidine Nalpha-methyltransferase
MSRNAVVVRSTRNQPTIDSDFETDVLVGLGRRRKSLPAKYLYDASGSALFDRITGLAEYYVTRSEVGILTDHGSAIGSLFPANSALIELGAGSSRKSRILLGATASIGAYVPVDISGDFLREDVAKLRTDFPHLAVHPLVCDFTKEFKLPGQIAAASRVGFFPGSTIGNFEPREAGSLLRHFGRVLGKGAILVVGVDLIKQHQILHCAYNDAEGVTGRFNLNILRRINRQLEANFYPAAFKHYALYNDRESRVEMHLVSKCRQEVRVKGRLFRFDLGETIHTENSYKYTMDSFQSLAAGSGWSAIRFWTDGLFSVHAFENRG